MSEKLSFVLNEVTLEVKFVNFNAISDALRTSQETFNSVLFFSNDKEVFLGKLTEFINDSVKANNEYRLVVSATNKDSGTSLVDAFRKGALELSDKKTRTVSSPSKALFEFHLMMLMKAFDGFSLLKFCLMLQHELTGCK